MVTITCTSLHLLSIYHNFYCSKYKYTSKLPELPTLYYNFLPNFDFVACGTPRNKNIRSEHYIQISVNTTHFRLMFDMNLYNFSKILICIELQCPNFLNLHACIHVVVKILFDIPTWICANLAKTLAHFLGPDAPKF